jgi:hypothetical protein
MQHWGAWRRRGIVLATIALSIAVLAPELATPAGAAVGPGRRHPAKTEAQRRARVLAAMRAHGYTKAAKNAKLRQLAAKVGAFRKQGKKPNAKAPRTKAQRQRALRLRRQAARRRAALAAQRAAKKEAPLSLPLLAFLALLPFVLIGVYLLGADYWRRRGQREPRGRRKRGGASLVITRVGDR